MDALREAIVERGPEALALGGLLIGFVFGFIVYRTNFCTMGSISDIMSFGDYRRFRSWLLAGATAMIGVQLLHYGGVIDLGKTMYLSPSFNWLGNILGGLMFGFGMVFAGGCASKNLARVGGGDLRAMLTLIVVGIFSYMTIGGLLGPIRNWLATSTSVDLEVLGTPTQSFGDIVGMQAGLAPGLGNLIVMAVISALVLLYIFKDKDFRSTPTVIIAGLGIGLCVIAGWLLTGLAFDEMAERPTTPISLSYVRPTGDALEYLQRFTADMIPGFGVASVFGALSGSFAAAMMMGRFQITTFADKGDTKRNLFGAVLMGVGGVMALGCTVGQAITGISTLAIGSFVTFASIFIGGVAGMKAFERVLMAEA